jgi:uncharacterized membrane protein
MVTSPLPLDSPPFFTSMTHLYRGEMHRMTVWRQRLDVTSNWAILLTFGLTTFTLGSRDIPHYTLLLGLALIGISLVIEARRYRHLHHSKWRLYLLEAGYFVEVLKPGSGCRAEKCRELLAEDLRQPRYTVSWLTAARLRLRSNYLLLFYFITAVWIVKLFVHPSSPDSLAEFYARLTVGELIPSWFVAITATGFVATAAALALTCPSPEVLEDWSQQLAAPGQQGTEDPAPL